VVTGVSSPEWSDDELLRELRGALREPPAGEEIIRAARAAFAWRTVDDDLEILTLDADRDLAGAGQVRGAGPGSPLTLTFHGKRLSVAVEIDGSGLIGQLTPPGPGQVTLMTADGPRAATQADEVGCFALPPPPSGPMRLDCQRGADRFVTEWTSI
jgi:hypothetical protein